MAYLTPENTPASNRCWRLSIPRDQQILGAILGQLLELTKPYHWEQTTGISVSETTALMQILFDEFSVGSYCMIGSLIHYVTLSAPLGVLECDGSQYLRVDYPDLYADLPPSLIVDADNFLVPDIQDVFMLASGATYSPLDTGGEIEHVMTVGEMPIHNHTSSPHNHSDSGATPSTVLVNAGVPTPSALTLPTLTGGASAIIDNSGNDEAHENMPPFVAFKVGIVAR